jgi:hypothetical protein
MEIKNILGYELGAHMRLIHEKNQRPKISCYCTFKDVSAALSVRSGIISQRTQKIIQQPTIGKKAFFVLSWYCSVNFFNEMLMHYITLWRQRHGAIVSLAKVNTSLLIFSDMPTFFLICDL